MFLTLMATDFFLCPPHAVALIIISNTILPATSLFFTLTALYSRPKVIFLDEIILRAFTEYISLSKLWSLILMLLMEQENQHPFYLSDFFPLLSSAGGCLTVHPVSLHMQKFAFIALHAGNVSRTFILIALPI